MPQKRAPPPIHQCFNAFKTFDIHLWLLMLIVFVAQILSTSVISNVERRLHGYDLHWTPTNSAWHMYRFVVGQKFGELSFRTIGDKLLFVIRIFTNLTLNYVILSKFLPVKRRIFYYLSNFLILSNLSLTIWSLLQCVLMVGLYRCLLLTHLLNAPKVAPFANAEEMVQLIAAKQYKLVTNNLANW
jgi:hypothetical protein